MSFKFLVSIKEFGINKKNYEELLSFEDYVYEYF